MRDFKTIEVFILEKLRSNLSKQLYYHCPRHTMDVVQAAELIAAEEGISNEELFLLKVAALYHDAGYIFAYNDHEAASCQLAKTDLPAFGLNQKEIEIICAMIMATKTTSKPETQLEKIISDADLEYLGTSDFDELSNNLFEEAKIFLNVKSKNEWDEIQVKFLSRHHYYTKFCLENREPEKQKHLNEVKARL